MMEIIAVNTFYGVFVMSATMEMYRHFFLFLSRRLAIGVWCLCVWLIPSIYGFYESIDN